MSPARPADPHADRILILDFGAQYTQLIARRVREIGVYCEIWAWDHDPAEIAAFGARGIILSGGPESTTEHGAPKAPPQVFDAGLPISLNSDDPTLFHTTITKEFLLIADHFAFTVDEICRIAQQGIRGAFLPPAERERLLAEMQQEQQRLRRELNI